MIASAITYREFTERFAQTVEDRTARYHLYLGFYREIPVEMINASVPICRTAHNSNLFIPAATYAEALEISRMFPDHRFHTYASTTAMYSTDLGFLHNGAWEDVSGHHAMSLPSGWWGSDSIVHYYNHFDVQLTFYHTIGRK